VGYDRFAKFYDYYWTKDAPTLFEKVLSRLVLPELPERAEILDLCCGTGQLCERLSQRRFRLTGLDRSEEMLSFARKNAPSALFSLQNAENFSFPQKFSSVISMFDSVNHFLTEDALSNLFNSVREALAPDGIFFFDINDRTAFGDEWEEGFSMADSAGACIVKPVFEPVNGSISYNIVVFEKTDGECYTRINTTVKERWYPNETLLKLLRLSGFNEVRIFDGTADLKIQQFKDRLFFLARSRE
jgi:SAM-dependent methyltransferase